MRKALPFALTCLMALGGAPDSGAQLRPADRLGYAVNDFVDETTRVGNVVYAVGGFTTVVPQHAVVGRFVELGAASAQPVRLPRAQVGGGSVFSQVSDGAGGWDIGGSFSTVGGAARARFAHLTSAGLLDASFVPTFNGTVEAMQRVGTVLYVVGGFTNVSGQVRGGGAAFNLAAGNALLSWNPDLNTVPGTQQAEAIVVSGPTVFLGGSFTTASASARVGFAAVDATTGALRTSPAADTSAGGSVWALALAGGRLYLGGTFTTLAGAPRTNLAAIDAATGAVQGFAADTDGQVLALVVDGDIVRVGGRFGRVDGQTRRGAAAVDAVTGTLEGWAPDVGGTSVMAIMQTGGSVYLGGSFSSVGGQPRANIAAVQATSGEPLPWNPGLNFPVFALVAGAAGEVAAGGAFTHVGATARSNLAAFDLLTGDLLPLSIAVDGLIRGVSVAGDTLYLAGQFTRVNEQTRNGFAAIDRRTGALRAWNPDATGTIAGNSGGRTILIVGARAFIGGFFSSVGGQARVGLAEVDATTGAPAAFNGDAFGGGVSKLRVVGSTLYASGSFAGLSGQARPMLAAFDISGTVPSLTAFDVHASGSAGAFINSTAIVGTTMYLGGSFTSVGGQPRTGAAAVSLPDGIVTPFAPSVTGLPVWGIDVFNGSAYLAGAFTSVNGQARRVFAAVDAATGGTTLAFNPGLFGNDGRDVSAGPEGVIAAGATSGSFTQLFFFPSEAMGGLPGPPTTPVAHISNGNLDLSWGPPTLGGEPTDYLLDVGFASGTCSITLPLGSTSRHFTHGGVPPGLYFARVRAVSAAGPGPASPEIAFASGIPGCNGNPQPPALGVSVTGGDVSLSWPDPAGSNGGLAYRLSAGTGPGLTNVGTFSLGAVKTFSAVAPPGNYFATLAAEGPCGRPAASTEVLISVGGAMPTESPVLTGRTSTGNVSLAWTTVPGAVYRLDAGSGPGLSNIVQLAMGGTTSISAPVPPGTYYVRIIAIGPGGASYPSNESVLVVP